MFTRLLAGLAWLALAVSLLSPVAAFSSAEVLEDAELRIHWPASSDAASIWQVAVPGAESDRWRSLVSQDEHGQQISHHLGMALSGVEHWQIIDEATAEPAIERRWQSSDGNWQLELALQPAAGTYRTQLDLRLQALGPTGPNRLSLQLGPGMGELPMAGLGMATSLYSYTHPVHHHRGALSEWKKAPDSEPLVLETGDWTGLHSRYFALLAALQEGAGPVQITMGRIADQASLSADFLPWITLGFPVEALATGERLHWRLELFSGPKTQQALKGAPPSLDYSPLLFQNLWSWMRHLSLGLMWALAALHTLIPSWGLAICLLAVLVRLLLYPLGRWAMSSQQRFAEVQAEISPKIREIKQNYRGGEQSERILQLYEARGVSPLAGLKPLLIVLIQLPVFVALFHVLGQVFEFRDASFLWMQSLAEPDRLFAFGVNLPFFGAWFNLLPVLMAITTLASIKLSPAPAASAAEKRRQNLFLLLMAVVFFLLFYPFPSGMVLYWIMANLLYIAQFQVSKLRPA